MHKTTVRRPTRIHVANVVKLWLASRPTDFVGSAPHARDMVRELKSMLADQLSVDLPALAKSISNLLDRQAYINMDEEAQSKLKASERACIFSETPPEPMIPDVDAASGRDLGLMDLDDLELARQCVPYLPYAALRCIL